jgi:hypothetical protein
MKHINKPICFVVALKTYPSGNTFGKIHEFVRDSKGNPKLFSTMQQAIKAVKAKREESHINNWVAMTTWRLAEQHSISLR